MLSALPWNQHGVGRPPLAPSAGRTKTPSSQPAPNSTPPSSDGPVPASRSTYGTPASTAVPGRPQRWRRAAGHVLDHGRGRRPLTGGLAQPRSPPGADRGGG